MSHITVQGLVCQPWY